jgi:accessory colonization factor AcfC
MMKKGFLTLLMGTIVLWGFGFESYLWAQDKPLHIYGPEGPFAPMKECAEMFYRSHGVKADVLTGPGSNWITKAKEDADVVYEETEYQLSHFMTRHP